MVPVDEEEDAAEVTLVKSRYSNRTFTMIPF